MKENQKDVINLAALLQFLQIYLPFQFGVDKVEAVSYTEAEILVFFLPMTISAILKAAWIKGLALSGVF